MHRHNEKSNIAKYRVYFYQEQIKYARGEDEYSKDDRSFKHNAFISNKNVFP